MAVPTQESGQKPHGVSLEARKKLTATGVSDVDSFDEETVVAYTSLGEMTVRGVHLKIRHLDVQSGELVIDGEITSLHYTDNQSRSVGFLRKLFR